MRDKKPRQTKEDERRMAEELDRGIKMMAETGGSLRTNIEDYTITELIGMKEEIDELYGEGTFRDIAGQTIARLLITSNHQE